MALVIRSLASVTVFVYLLCLISRSKCSSPGAEDRYQIVKIQGDMVNRQPRNILAMQNAIGILQAIGILHKKLSLFEEMLSAQDAAPDSTDIQISDAVPPGPLLAYSDCRLGILPLHVCTHLGFKRDGTIVPPSSLQSKMLVLPEARALVRATQAGRLALNRDEGLKELLGAELLKSASDAFLAFKEAQLLVPSFQAASISLPALQNARKLAEVFFNAVTREHKLFQLPKADGGWEQLQPEELALIFANVPRY